MLAAVDEPRLCPLAPFSCLLAFPAVADRHRRHTEPTNPFPAHLRTLVLELTTNILAPSVVVDAFQLLQEAKFARMPEVTLLHSHARLVYYVLQALGDSVVSLELASRHVRLVTDTGTAVNFMRTDFSWLEDAVSLDISRSAPRLRTLHLGTRVLGIFGGVTLAGICNAAQGIERLVLMGVPSLNLPALREMRLLAPLDPGRNIRADDLAGFVCDRLRLSSGAAPLTLTLESVEIIGVPQGCAVSCEMLADILWEVFGDVSLDQSLLNIRGFVFAMPASGYWIVALFCFQSGTSL